MLSGESYRFVITLACESERLADTTELALKSNWPYRSHVERLGDRTLNWVVDAPGPGETAGELERGAPQCYAADWAVAGLVVLGLVEAVNWQSCRRVGPRGGLGPELPVI